MKVEKRQAKKDGKGKKRNFKSHESNFEWEQLTHMSSIWWNQNAPKINKTCRIHRMHLFWNGSIYSNPWNDGLRQRLTTHMLVFATSHHLKYNFFFVLAQFILLRQRRLVLVQYVRGAWTRGKNSNEYMEVSSLRLSEQR